MSQLGGGHLGYDPYSPADVSPVRSTVTSLDQAVPPPNVGAISTVDCQHPTEDTAREIYDGLVCESGRAMCEMAVAVAKLSKATVVDFAAVTTPVLAMKAEYDRVIPSGGVRQTAARYQHGTYVEIPRSDHMVFSGAALPVTMGHIDDWIARNHVLAIA